MRMDAIGLLNALFACAAQWPSVYVYRHPHYCNGTVTRQVGVSAQSIATCRTLAMVNLRPLAIGLVP